MHAFFNRQNHALKTYYPFIRMYFDIVLLDEKCSKCIYQIVNSNDLVRTASESVRWNNELSVYEKKNFSTYHCTTAQNIT